MNTNRKKWMLLLFFNLFCLISYTQTRDIYKESDYILVRTDSSKDWKDCLGRKFYIYKYDTLRRMVVDYYCDGKILGKGFYYKETLTGPLTTFGYDQRIIEVDSFRNGQKYSEKSFTVPDTSSKFFNNGKLTHLNSNNIDSLLK